MLLVSAFPEQNCKSWLGPGAEIFIRSSFVFLCLQMPKISPHVHARDTFVPRYSLNKKHGGRSGEETNKLRKDYVEVEWTNGYPGDFSAVCSLCCLIKVRKKHSVLANNLWRGLLKKAIGAFSRLEWHPARPPPLTLIFSIFYEIKLGIFSSSSHDFRFSIVQHFKWDWARALSRIGHQGLVSILVFRRHGAVFVPQKITAFGCFYLFSLVIVFSRVN